MAGSVTWPAAAHFGDPWVSAACLLLAQRDTYRAAKECRLLRVLRTSAVAVVEPSCGAFKDFGEQLGFDLSPVASGSRHPVVYLPCRPSPLDFPGATVGKIFGKVRKRCIYAALGDVAGAHLRKQILRPTCRVAAPPPPAVCPGPRAS